MRAWIVLAATLTVGCIAPPSPAERLAFSASEMNSATRFGRMDVALAHVSADLQDDFLRRHARWGREVRIVDLEVEGIRFVDKGVAEVNVVVAWHRLDETVIRASAVTQTWKQDDDGWKVFEEHRVGGEPGVFAIGGKKTGSRGLDDQLQLRNDR